MFLSYFLSYNYKLTSILNLFFRVFFILIVIGCQPSKEDSRSQSAWVEIPTEDWFTLQYWIAENDPFGTSEVDSFSVDLNGDTKHELFICFPAECGTAGNCLWYVMQRKNEYVNEIGFIEGSIEILQKKTNGYRDVSASWHLSAENRTLSIYRFENGTYKLAEYFDCRIDVNGNEIRVPIQIKK